MTARALPLSLLICLVAFHGTTAAQTGSAVPPAEAAALQQFEAAVRDYVGLRNKLSSELPPLTVTSNPNEITARSDALARAIERGRGSAPVGHFFTREVVEMLRRRVGTVAQRSEVRAVIVPNEDEKPTIAALRVHARFPLTSPLTTMPTQLLDVLPPLPRALEYRFIGTTLVLRDVEAAMILDYAQDVVTKGR